MFRQLEEDIAQADVSGSANEIELTSALEAVRQKSGMIGVRLDGVMYDMGNHTAFRNAVLEYSKE